MPGDEVASYLVRHAKAGSRERWTAPDRDRPLTAAGRVQAAALTRLLQATTRVVSSSPYLRCVETVAPLAEALAKSKLDRRTQPGIPAISWRLLNL